MSNNIAEYVSKISPLLGAALGPAGSLGGIVISLIANLFSANPEKPEEILDKMKSDPEVEFKLKKLEEDHFEALSAHFNELAVSEVKDRGDARNMQISNRDWIVHFLAIGLLVGFFLYVSLGLFIPDYFDKGIFHDILNVLMLVFSFYFGKSYIGNQEK